MDANGNVTEAAAHDDKNTAEKHTGEFWCQDSCDWTCGMHDIEIGKLIILPSIIATQDPEVEEVTELFKGLTKKKKSSSKKSKSADDDADGAAAADTEAGADSLDLSKMKKKKKKSKKEGTDFETKLAEAGLTEQQAAQVADEKPPSPEEIADDLENARGIWAHDATTAIPYNFLVTRFYSLVSNNHPDLLLSGSKSYKIPPPQCLREGNRRTIFANIADICKRMKRSEEHVMQFLFAELGTSGSVDGAGRLVIKGRFQQKQIENVLRRYIGMFQLFLSPASSSFMPLIANT